MAIFQPAIDRLKDGRLTEAEIRAFNTRDRGLCDQCGEDITRHITECLPLRWRLR